MCPVCVCVSTYDTHKRARQSEYKKWVRRDKAAGGGSLSLRATHSRRALPAKERVDRKAAVVGHTHTRDISRSRRTVRTPPRREAN